MAPKPKLSLEQQIDLQQTVAVEVEEHRKGEIEKFTTTQELTMIYNIHKDTISRYLKKLIPIEYLEYRNSHLSSQIRSGKNHAVHHIDHDKDNNSELYMQMSEERRTELQTLRADLEAMI